MMRSLIVGLTTFALAQTGFSGDKKPHATGLIVPVDADYGVPFLSRTVGDEPLPEAFDLREQGHMSPVRNQGSCGSCWAFAGIAAMESALLKHQSSEFNLSEQEIVSCDRSASGCSGGWQPFDYMIKNGVGLESDFPYAGRNLSCKKIPTAAKALRWGNLGAADRRASVEEVRQGVYDFGALWVTVGANGNWRGNSSGLISRCSNTTVNHAVTLAGYVPSESTPGKYNFLIKNSWGTSWGDDGYIKSPLGCNNLARHVSFVVPADHQCAPPEFGLAKKISLGRSGGLIPVPGLENAGLEYTWYKVGTRGETSGPIAVGPNEAGDFVVKTRTACGVWTQKLKVTR